MPSHLNTFWNCVTLEEYINEEREKAKDIEEEVENLRRKREAADQEIEEIKKVLEEEG